MTPSFLLPLLAPPCSQGLENFLLLVLASPYLRADVTLRMFLTTINNVSGRATPSPPPVAAATCRQPCGMERAEPINNVACGRPPES